MKIKPLAYFIVFFAIILIFISLFSIIKITNKNLNWQLLIEKQIGSKSTLNIGKNLSFDNSSIYFSDTDSTIYCVNKETGQIRWTTQINDHSPFQVTLDQNFAYVASFDSHIYKIDKKNGLIDWSFAIPDQFWPDTEVVVDNDSLVFFADRAGILRALNKENGKIVWQKEFGSIDSSKTFVENSIHFGFLNLQGDILIADHFPSKTTFKLNKKTGDIIDQHPSSLKINWPKYKNVFSTDSYDLIMTNNIIHQPTFELADKEKNLLWLYQTENRINEKEIYQNNNRLYYFDATNRLITSIKIDSMNPNNQQFKQLNFEKIEDFSKHEPFEKLAQQHNQQIDFVLKKSLFRKTAEFLSELKIKIKYLADNFREISVFSITSQEKPNYLELSMFHNQNFYKNPFTALDINIEFTNLDTKEKIQVKGFYYDFNLWKAKAKLSNGNWQWQSTIRTFFCINKQKGIIQINNTKDNIRNEKFFTLGIQSTIVDKNMDGNPLNQMGYAKNLAPIADSKQYNYLNFTDYLDLYQNEAGINLFRYGPDNWAPSIWKNINTVKSFAMDVNGSLQGDIIVDEAKKRNMQIMMTIFAFYPPYSSRESIANKNNQKILKKYLDYVIARYSSSIDVWELSNEAIPSLEWKKFISDYLAQNDPYHHTITTNLEATDLNNSNLLSVHLYTHPENNKELVDIVEKLLNKYRREQNWNKDIVVSELGFSDANYFPNSINTDSSANLMRKMTWIFAFKKVGVVFWNTGEKLLQNTGHANIYLGPQERFFLKKLQDFLPKEQSYLQSNFKITNNDKLAVYSLENEQNKLFYLLNLNENKFSNKSSYRLSLEILEVKKTGETIILELINPSNNFVIKTITIKKDTTYIDLPYFKEDLAAKIVY